MYQIIRFLLLVLVSTVVISCGGDSSTNPVSLVDIPPPAPPPPPPPPPASPTGLAITAGGTNTIDLSWSAVSTATFYEIYRNTNGASSTSTLIDVSEGSSYQDTGLAASTTYYYWLKACDDTSCSAYSSLATAITQSNPPTSPTSLAATAGGISTIDLSWNAVSTVTFYEIYRNSGDTSSTSAFIDVSGGNSYQDTGLEPSTTYYYWLKACDANGCSNYSNLATAITQSNPPTSPTSLAATAGGISTIDLSWSAVSAATFYEIYRNTNGASSTSTLIDVSEGSSYQDTGLAASTTYYYWLKACDANGCSNYSSLASATTQVDVQATRKLNDTGIFWGGDYAEVNNSSCTSNISSPQDCHQGRDAKASASTLSKTGDGAAGFDFTKLGINGNELAIQNATYADNGNESDGTKWSCVRDNHTDLVWEVKLNDSNSIHYKDTTYRWGGLTAIGRDHASKKGDYYDDWNDLVSGTNSENLCGFSDWRVPDIEELSSIVHLGRANPSIDTNYFPNTASSYFWSASPATSSSHAWPLHFNEGYVNSNRRYFSDRLRLVHAEQ